MRIAVFGGSFDPIHTGHLLLAQDVRCTFNLDYIYFIPTYMSPHKQNKPFASNEDRITMIKLAIKDNKYFKLSNIELERKGCSYTIDTINALYKTLSSIEGKINLIIGADLIHTIKTWKSYEELITKTKIIVATKEDYIASDYTTKYSFIQSIDNILFKISSSIIRDRIKSGKSVRYLLSKEVEQYIQKQSLYI